MSTIRVDRITPYQSGSVAIEGLNITNLTIDGTLTASLQQGYVWVGGSGNVSTLAPTSSFGGGGGGSDITALNAFTASQEDLNLTFATTGSNTFYGTNLFSGSLQLTGSLQFRSPSYRNGIGADQSGSVLTLNPQRISLATKPSGSGYTGVIQVYDNLDGNSIATMDSRILSIGTSTAISVQIGNDTAGNFYRGNNYYYGNITGSQSIKANSFTGSFTGSVAVAPSKAIIFSDEHIAISSNGIVPNTSGSYVVKIGQGAGEVNRVSFNTFIGHYAGYSNTTGQNNTYVGNTSAYNNVAGIENTYVGTNTGGGAVSGSQNAILGFGTGYYSNGNNNTFIGTRTVTSLGTGSENVVVGAYAATGSSNDEYLRFLSASVILGYGASPMDDNETNQVIIGHKAIGNGSNTVTIGNNGITNTYLKGTISGSTFTGSFEGDGSGLTGITLPSGVVSGSEQILGGSGILSSSETNFTDFSQSIDTRIDNIVAGTGFATTGSNTFVGTQTISGSLNVSGSNTFVGNQGITGSIVVSGSISQIGVGGTGNIFIGDEPSTNMTSDAQYNVIIGQDAGILNSSGSTNVFIGKSAGTLNQIGNNNVYIGTYSGYNSKLSNNVMIGESAGFNNIMGQYNVFVGQQSGYNNKVSNNTFIGYQSGFANTSGSDNTFVGYQAGNVNTVGDNNSFFGYNSGRDNSVGENNTFLGNFTGQTNTSGSFNTFVGSSAGQNHKTAVYNTFVGMNAGLNTGVGNENTFLGFQAGNNNLSGSQNTLIGANANGLSTFSNYVTAVGYGAAYGVTTGSNSVYLGNAAGRYLSDGMTNVTSNTNSVFIGTDSKSNLNAQSNQIVIGYNAVSNGTNTVTIGNNDITDTYVKGTLRASTAILAQVSSSYNFADDTAAQAGGVPLGGLYHTSGSIKIRLV